MEPHSLVRGTGEGGSVRLGPGLRPPRPTPHGPPTSLGGREKWFVDGRNKWETKRFFSSFSQRVPVHVPSPPSRWAGRYGPSSVRAAGQVFRQKYSLPPTQPHQRRESRGKNLFPLGFFPPFLPKKWGPGWASQGSLPFQRRKEKPTMGPAREGTVPRRSNGVGEEPHTAPPPRACPPTAQFAIFEKGSHLCQRKICPFLRCFFNTAPPPPWPLS